MKQNAQQNEAECKTKQTSRLMKEGGEAEEAKGREGRFKVGLLGKRWQMTGSETKE